MEDIFPNRNYSPLLIKTV